MNENIKKKVKKKKNAWKKYLDHEKYKEINKALKLLIKESKKEKWVEFGNKLVDSYNENQKMFY